MSWDTAKLKDICESTTTWSPNAELREQITYIDVSAVTSELCKILSPQTYEGRSAPGRARKIVRTGDTIFATIRPTLRRIAHIEPNFDNQIASTAFCVLRPNQSKVDPRFLYFAVRDDRFVEAVGHHQRGSSYPAVRDKDILAEVIPLPPLDEQRSIGAILWKIQQAIEVETDLIRVSRELKTAVMKKLFTEGLNGEPQKETEIGLVPESWEVVPFGEVLTTAQYGLSVRGNASGAYPILRMNCQIDGRVHFENLQ